MKRLLNIFLLILTLFSAIPYKVNADCGISPVQIDAIVSNKAGAKLYDEYSSGGKYGYKETSKNLNYGDSIVILYEYQGYAYIEVHEQGYYIKESDYTYVKNMAAVAEKYVKYYAYADTIIRNVPSFYSYEVVTTIPANTFFDIDGETNGDETFTNSATGWAAVSYKGKTGWVYVGGCDVTAAITVAHKYAETKEAYVFKNYDYKTGKFSGITEGYKILGDDSTKQSINLNYRDKVEILYTHEVGHNRYYYIKTNSISGIWIYNPPLYVENDKNVIFTQLQSESYKVYSFDNFSNKNLIINENEIYKYKYNLLDAEYEDAYATDLDGKMYWIYIDNAYDVTSFQLSKESLTLKLENNYKYNTFNDPETEGVISKGEYEAYKVIERYSTEVSYYVPAMGFVTLDDEYIVDKEENNNTSNDIENNISNENNSEIIEDVISPKQFVVYCLVGTVSVALVAAIAIVILHRIKKDAKKVGDE